MYAFTSRLLSLPDGQVSTTGNQTVETEQAVSMNNNGRQLGRKQAGSKHQAKRKVWEEG